MQDVTWAIYSPPMCFRGGRPLPVDAPDDVNGLRICHSGIVTI